MMIEHHLHQRTAEAIVQLAVAIATDRDTVATLTATNAKLDIATRNFASLRTKSQGRHCAIEAQDQTRLARSTTTQKNEQC
jgi:hypothetical protein